MSRFLYVASDHQMEEQPNPYVEVLSINEAIEKGLELELDMFNQSVDRDKPGVILWVEDEEKLEVPEFCDIENKEYYDEIITKKPYCIEVQGNIRESNADIVVSYIKKNVEKGQELEFWKVWLDEEIRPDFHDIELISINDLTNEKLLEVINSQTYPMCLRIYK
ncbi:MAG: hypothetical protein Q4F05_16160 [bacterium]|nr:hypothetical protein [bacterium]